MIKFKNDDLKKHKGFIIIVNKTDLMFLKISYKKTVTLWFHYNYCDFIWKSKLFILYYEITSVIIHWIKFVELHKKVLI